MPPALHPRSRMTLSLFWTTLGLSFAVVGLPHILPCPVPHSSKKMYTDGQGKPRRRKKITQDEETTEASPAKEEDMGRECPIPKPGGLVGQVLGFEQKQKELDRPTIVKIESKDRSSNTNKDTTQQADP